MISGTQFKNFAVGGAVIIGVYAAFKTLTTAKAAARAVGDAAQEVNPVNDNNVIRRTFPAAANTSDSLINKLRCFVGYGGNAFCNDGIELTEGAEAVTRTEPVPNINGDNAIEPIYYLDR